MEYDHIVTIFGVEYGVNFCCGLEDGIMDEHTEISVHRVVNHDQMLTAAFEEPGVRVYSGDTPHSIAHALLRKNRRMIESYARQCGG